MVKWPIIKDEQRYLQRLSQVLHSDRWTIRAQESGYYLTEEFEKKWANFCDRKFALLVNSGSAALEILLRASSIQPGDEIIVPALGWYATSAAVCKVGAIPVFCDVDPATTCLLPESVEDLISHKTRAVICVHLHCSFAPLTSLKEICDQHHILLLEDAAQAHGGTYNHQPPGYYSKAACYSFNQEKLIPGGEGGAIVTDDETLFKKAYALRTDGHSKLNNTTWEPAGILGFNFCVSEFQAAVLLESLTDFQAYNATRLQNAAELITQIQDLEGVGLIERSSQTTCPFYYELGLFFPHTLLKRQGLDKVIAHVNKSMQVCIGRTDMPVPYNPLFKAYYQTSKAPRLKNAQKVYDSMAVLHHKYLLHEPSLSCLINSLRTIL